MASSSEEAVAAGSSGGTIGSKVEGSTSGIKGLVFRTILFPAAQQFCSSMLFSVRVDAHEVCGPAACPEEAVSSDTWTAIKIYGLL